MNMSIDFYALHRAIHKAEVQELKNRVINYGGNVCFTDICDDDDNIVFKADINEQPVVAVNVSKHQCGPLDAYIDRICIVDGHMEIWATYVENPIDPFLLDPDDIEFGHVSFIIDLIPDVVAEQAQKRFNS